MEDDILEIDNKKINVQWEQKEILQLIAFIFGACIPIAILGFAVLERGEIATYQIESIKNLWYLFALWSCVAGIIVCVIYFLLILLIRKIIRKNVS